MSEAPDFKIFQEFHQKIVEPLRVLRTSQRVLEEFVDADVNSEAVAKIIQRNQYVEFMLLQEIRALGLKENTPSLHGAIALLGMQRVRNFVCALQLITGVLKRHPGVSADGKPDFKAEDFLKYAVRTGEYASSRRLAFPDAAYAAGMVYDILIAIGREVFQAAKTFEEYVTEVYKHGMRAAIVAAEVSKSLKGFTFGRHVFAACLIHDVGKLAMELLFASGPNSYTAFRAELGKKPLKRPVRHFVESKRFGLTHEYYSAQMAHSFFMFRSAERAILFHHDPYTVHSVNKDLYQFSALIALASNMASNFRIPKDSNDPVYKEWLPIELKDFKIDHKLLLATMSKVVRESF